MIATILGSNSGDKYQLLKEAAHLLSASGKIIQQSSFYETEPWGFESDENFLNQVIIFETPLNPSDFLHRCLEVEKKLGRVRNHNGPRYTSRPIDIDILFCDSQIINTPELTVPHPRICERHFVLAPLAEVMPDFIHPGKQKSVLELLSICPDHSIVKRI